MERNDGDERPRIASASGPVSDCTTLLPRRHDRWLCKELEKAQRCCMGPDVVIARTGASRCLSTLSLSRTAIGRIVGQVKRDPAHSQLCKLRSEVGPFSFQFNTLISAGSEKAGQITSRFGLFACCHRLNLKKPSHCIVMMPSLATRHSARSALANYKKISRQNSSLNVSVRSRFQLPTSFAPMFAPNSISMSRDSPFHMTMLPGGGSLARAR
jgi:hypothetical protein